MALIMVTATRAETTTLRYTWENMSQKTVLIADDSLDLCEAMREMLEHLGYRALEAHDGKETLEVAKREHPDLILLDIVMPELTGFEVMQALKKDPWGKDAKILVLTASATTEDIPPDLNLSQKDFLFKTQCSMNQIAEKIAAKIGT